MSSAAVVVVALRMKRKAKTTTFDKHTKAYNRTYSVRIKSAVKYAMFITYIHTWFCAKAYGVCMNSVL